MFTFLRSEDEDESPQIIYNDGNIKINIEYYEYEESRIDLTKGSHHFFQYNGGYMISWNDEFILISYSSERGELSIKVNSTPELLESLREVFNQWNECIEN